MASTLPDAPKAAQHLLADVRPEMAKVTEASLPKPEPGRRLIGRALERAYKLRGWSLKEFAGALDRDERQIARWLDGSERPQFDLLFALDEDFRCGLVIAFAQIAGEGVIVTTHIHVTQRQRTA